MTEPNNNPTYSLHPSNIPGAYQEFRADHAAVEDELIEKVIARVVLKFIESIGNSMIERIQSLVPYLMVLSSGFISGDQTPIHRSTKC